MQKEIKVGKKIIDILMFSMYPDAKIIYREYIQNARDAIKDAVDAKILNSIRDGHITISIDNIHNTIEIKDNGIGISENEIFEKLLNIADSTKDGETSAGQFGIGRLVGGGYCKKLSFITSFKGERTKSIVEYDIEKARKIIDDERDISSATEVIQKIIEIDSEAEDENEHYFIARLENIKNDYPSLLNETVITEYLQQVAPIDYQMPFKNQLIELGSDPHFKTLHKQLKYCKLTVNDNLDIRKTYTQTIIGTNDDIDSLQYFEIKDDNFGKMAWGWYAITRFSKKIPQSDKSRCIRLRKHNIMLGSETFFDEYFKEERGNYYFYGEVHIIHPKLKPDSSRSGLAPTPEAEKFKVLVKQKFDELHNLYYLANAAKNEIKKAENTVQVATLTTKIDNLKANKETDATRKLKEIYKKEAEEKITNPLPKLLPKPISKHQPITPVLPQFKISNPYEELKAKGGIFAAQETITLLERIMNLFRLHCPPTSKELLDELINKVINDLGK